MVAQMSVGDVEAPTVEVEPYDETTAATLTVTSPDGTATTPAVSQQDDTPQQGTQTWVGAPVTYSKAGRWVLHWAISGLGGKVVDQEVYAVASPVAGGPTWTPARTRVAVYVPLRTLARDTETHEQTFSSTTLPSGVQVDRLIADAVRWVLARTGEVDPTLHEFAASVSAVRAAMAVERGYPAQEPEQSLRRARDLEEQAQRMLDDLAFANQTPETQGTALVPLYAFPEPVAWGDTTFI